MGIVDSNCGKMHWGFRDQAWFLSKKRGVSVEDTHTPPASLLYILHSLSSLETVCLLWLLSPCHPRSLGLPPTSYAPLTRTGTLDEAPVLAAPGSVCSVDSLFSEPRICCCSEYLFPFSPSPPPYSFLFCPCRTGAYLGSKQ